MRGGARIVKLGLSRFASLRVQGARALRLDRAASACVLRPRLHVLLAPRRLKRVTRPQGKLKDKA